MTDRGYMRGRLAALGFVVLGVVAGAAPTLATEWTGPYIGFKSDYVSSPITYTNTGTPGQNLTGAMLGVAGGVDVSMNNIVVGVAGDAVFGNLNAFVRDGNYITESGKINVSGTVRGRVGIAMGDFLPYFTGGVMITNLEQGEVCPAPAAAPFGFCNTHGPFDLKGTKTLIGGTVGGGLEVMIAPGWSLQAQYLHTFFPEANFVLGPDGIGQPLPPSIAHLNYNEGSLTLAKRF